MNNSNSKYKFVKSKLSSKESLIISENENNFLITIDEYDGDYALIEKKNCTFINLNDEEKLSLLANYGNWFYNEYKDLFQELIINVIINNRA